MKVLVTGAAGQLGRDLRQTFASQHEVKATHRSDLDITNLDQVFRAVDEFRPDLILHAAAYTAVDQAEKEVDAAFAVNAYGSRNMAVAAEKQGAKFCYISTDYVFAGQALHPYREYDPTFPQSVYGQSKLAGERLVESLTSRHFIVRTSWVYGAHGSNFVKTMLRLAREQIRLQERGEPWSPLKVVHDQIGSPTYTMDLTRFLLELTSTERYGIYHATNAGACSWYEFAQAIFAEAQLSVVMEACATEDFLRPAPRPRYSVLDHLALRVNGFTPLRPWQEGVREFFAREGAVLEST